MKRKELWLKRPPGIDELAGSLNPGYSLKGLAEELDEERKRGER